jgi:hypothetical protein
MAYPEGGGDDEWIELYNMGSSTITLTDWYVDDGENAGGQPRQFTLILPPLSFATIDIDMPLLNNAGDTARLLDETKKEIIRMEYLRSEQGYSWALPEDSSEYCMQIPTKGAPNGVCDEIDEEASQETTTSTYTISPTPILYTIPPETSSTVPAETTYRFMFTKPAAQVPPDIVIPQPKTEKPLVLGARTEKDEEETPFHERLGIASFSLSFIAGLSIFLKSTR